METEPTHRGSPGKMVVRTECMCVCVCVVVADIWWRRVCWWRWTLTGGHSAFRPCTRSPRRSTSAARRCSPSSPSANTTRSRSRSDTCVLVVVCVLPWVALLGTATRLVGMGRVSVRPVKRVLCWQRAKDWLRRCTLTQGSHVSWKVLDFFLENSRTWKVLENHFGPEKSWKLKLKVLESPGKISLKVMHFF